MTDAEKIRLFIALELPPECKEKLSDLQNQLKPFARDGKWVNPQNIHLTLKFLGYVEKTKLKVITGALESVAPNFSAFPVDVHGCGFFPNARRPGVLWVGVRSAEMGALQKQVESAMEALGFEAENRAFSPHLTLCRFRDPTGRLPLVQKTEPLKDSFLGAFRCKEFVLFQSVLHRAGPEYTALKKFHLLKPHEH